MKVAVTGASGLIGSALVASLSRDGHEVLKLVRRPTTTPGEVSWDPAAGTIDTAGLAGAQAVVHLAGAGVGDKRWTEAYKQTILDSRVQGTRTLVRGLLELDTPPEVLVSGSAIGFYGDRGDEVLTEDSPAGTDGFLVDVVEQWEAEAEPAAAAGIRTVLARTGLVLSPEGGAFGRMLPLFKLGLNGPLGNGKQYWSWITLVDEVRALRHLIDTPSLSGPVNLGGPDPVSNAEVSRSLRRAVGKTLLPVALPVPVPSLALKVVLGEFSEDILGSQRVTSPKLAASGFTHQHGDIDTATRWVVEQTR